VWSLAASPCSKVTKAFHYAGANPAYFRLGTSGGIGVNPGDVVITTEAVNAQLESTHEEFVLGRSYKRSASFNADLVSSLKQTANFMPGFPVVLGKTLSTNCFYEGQGRVDGALCDYSEADKFKYLRRAFAAGVRNIEMESLKFASFTSTLGIPAATFCVALLNRLEDDQVGWLQANNLQFEFEISIH
jgi:uridine phosphorylase